VPETWQERKGDNMTKSKLKNLPRFGSLDELVKFFETHDLGEYWTEMPEAHFEVDIKRKTHLFAINTELANKLTDIAKSRKISSEVLISTWLGTYQHLVKRENSGTDIER
jgi:hypothetical protein